MESVNTLSMFWLYYVCPMLVRVSMESTDTLPRGYPWVGHTMYVQRWSEYPWFVKSVSMDWVLCISNGGQCMIQ